MNNLLENQPLKNAILSQFLASIRVVMVNTTLPANIGSAARAMHTMGLTQLVVVNPKHPIDEDAIAHAAGAGEILQTVQICDTLETAIADCYWVLAASSRKRHMPQMLLTPRQAAGMMVTQFQQISQNFSENLAANSAIKSHTQQSPFGIALVFGREDRGLTNEELQLADYHVQIPANPNYGVLNVAAAVQVIASVFFETASEIFCPELTSHFSDLDADVTNHDFLAKPVWTGESANPLKKGAVSQNLVNVDPTEKQIAYIIRQTWDEKPISHEQKHQLQAKLLILLEQLDLYHPDQPKSLPYRLARLANRVQLDVKEYEILQAALAKLQKRLG